MISVTLSMSLVGLFVGLFLCCCIKSMRFKSCFCSCLFVFMFHKTWNVFCNSDSFTRLQALVKVRTDIECGSIFRPHFFHPQRITPSMKHLPTLQMGNSLGQYFLHTLQGGKLSPVTNGVMTPISKVISWESKGTPPMPPPPGNKALLRDY